MATLSRAAFLVRFPEFGDDAAPEDLIDARLADAAARTPASVWGELQAEGHGYLTAHLIATSPWGQQARMSSDAGDSTYGIERRRLEKIVSAGGQVL